jgi:hypothetical protein
MTFAYSMNILICVVAFVAAQIQFFLVDPEHRVKNVYFVVGAGAVAMAILNLVCMRYRLPAFWLLLPAIAWCGFALYQFRVLPERPRLKKR